MGFFKKKTCPVCGGDMRSFSSYRVACNVKICSACETKMRGRYDMVQRGAVFYDTLSEIDVTKVKSIIDRLDRDRENDITELGEKYNDIMRVYDTFAVRSEGLESSEEDISGLAGKCVAFCFCECGEFMEGDLVRIIAQGCEKTARILKLIRCTGAYSFGTELISGNHETSVRHGRNAWIVLNYDKDGTVRGDRIVK